MLWCRLIHFILSVRIPKAHYSSSNNQIIVHTICIINTITNNIINAGCPVMVLIVTSAKRDHINAKVVNNTEVHNKGSKNHKNNLTGSIKCLMSFMFWFT